MYLAMRMHAPLPRPIFGKDSLSTTGACLNLINTSIYMSCIYRYHRMYIWSTRWCTYMYVYMCQMHARSHCEVNSHYREIALLQNFKWCCRRSPKIKPVNKLQAWLVRGCVISSTLAVCHRSKFYNYNSFIQTNKVYEVQ